MTAEITRLRPGVPTRGLGAAAHDHAEPLADPEQLPEPLTTAEDDVSGYPGFILDVGRLLASELVALATPEEGWAALMLWCRAWQQTPAGSLPDNERILAAFSGTGARWPEIREMALRGFVKCADGRLYHPVLCADAKRASAKRRAWRTRREEAECHAARPAAPRAAAPEEVEDAASPPAAKPEPISSVSEVDQTRLRPALEVDQTRLRIAPVTVTESCSLRSQRAREGDFECWWEQYPHKVGKPVAERAYRDALARASPELLLDAARDYARSKPPDRQWLNPASWLRQARWLDQPQPPLMLPERALDGIVPEGGRPRPRNPPSEALRQRCRANGAQGPPFAQKSEREALAARLKAVGFAGLGEDERWLYHAQVYAFRRVFLHHRDQTSPLDPAGLWFDEQLTAVFEAALDRERRLAKSARAPEAITDPQRANPGSS